jgi:hypothetical protein
VCFLGIFQYFCKNGQLFAITKIHIPIRNFPDQGLSKYTIIGCRKGIASGNPSLCIYGKINWLIGMHNVVSVTVCNVYYWLSNKIQMYAHTGLTQKMV